MTTDRELLELAAKAAGLDQQMCPDGWTDEQIDNVLPLGMAPYLTLCGPTEIRRSRTARRQRWLLSDAQRCLRSERT